MNYNQENHITRWVKLYRSFIDWEWFSVPNMITIFIYCLLKANHKNKKWRGIEIQKGSFITSIETISRDTNISKQSVRTCLKRLKKSGEINTRTNTQNTLVTICKYDSYQDFEKTTNKRLTNEQQTTNKRLTTTNNDNNIKNDNNNNIYNRFVVDVKNGCFDSRVESLCMRLKISKNDLTKLLDDFKHHVIEDNINHKTTNDYFKHFKNYLNIQDRLNKLNAYKKQSKGQL